MLNIYMWKCRAVYYIYVQYMFYDTNFADFQLLKIST